MNLDFLNNVDHEYFNYLADLHSKELTGPNRIRAALALHTAYFHGLKTLFSLIFAGLQAPKAIPAWILKCQNRQLLDLVEGANKSTPLTRASIQLADHSWTSIADFFNVVALVDNKDQDKGVSDLGELWKIFALDFANKLIWSSYNSFKHGFRVKSGGIYISFTPNAVSNSPPPKKFDLFRTNDGASFKEVTRIDEAPDSKTDRHFRLKDCHVNCRPEYAVDALRLISISIYNVVSCLKRTQHGMIVPGLIPKGTAWLSELKGKRAGFCNVSSGMTISENQITRFNDEALNKQFEAGRSKAEILQCADEIREK